MMIGTMPMKARRPLTVTRATPSRSARTETSRISRTGGRLPDALAYQNGSSSTESDVGLLRDADDAANWLEERFPSDTESLDKFIDETNFETSILVSLESTTPTRVTR